jgi:hypothetical protein
MKKAKEAAAARPDRVMVSMKPVPSCVAQAGERAAKATSCSSMTVRMGEGSSGPMVADSPTMT